MCGAIRDRWEAWVSGRDPFGTLAVWTDESIYYAQIVSDVTPGELMCLERSMNDANSEE